MRFCGGMSEPSYKAKKAIKILQREEAIKRRQKELKTKAIIKKDE